MQPNGQAPEWIAELIAEVERAPSRRWRDQDVRAAGLDPARVRRWFERHHGMTFHAYQRARRLGLALGQLRHGDDIMDAAFDQGYESLSGFRDAFGQLFDEPPGQSRGSTLVLITRLLTPLGPMVCSATSRT